MRERESPGAARRRRRHGQALVEFGLVFPILVIVMMAIIEFGLLLREYLAINYMLTEAAKEASLLRGSSDADLRVMKAVLNNSGGLDPMRLTYDLPGGQTYGPFRLEGDTLVTPEGAAAGVRATSAFFFDDNGTPEDTADDSAATAGDPAADYARLAVSYVHVNYGPYPEFMGITEFTITREKSIRLE